MDEIRLKNKYSHARYSTADTSRQTLGDSSDINPRLLVSGAADGATLSTSASLQTTQALTSQLAGLKDQAKGNTQALESNDITGLDVARIHPRYLHSQTIIQDDPGNTENMVRPVTTVASTASPIEVAQQASNFARINSSRTAVNEVLNNEMLHFRKTFLADKDNSIPGNSFKDFCFSRTRLFAAHIHALNNADIDMMGWIQVNTEGYNNWGYHVGLLIEIDQELWVADPVSGFKTPHNWVNGAIGKQPENDRKIAVTPFSSPPGGGTSHIDHSFINLNNIKKMIKIFEKNQKEKFEYDERDTEEDIANTINARNELSKGNPFPERLDSNNPIKKIMQNSSNELATLSNRNIFHLQPTENQGCCDIL